MSKLQHTYSTSPTEHVNLLREFQEREVDYLISLTGKGEKPDLPNNDSPFLRWMRSLDGTGKSPVGKAWCAATRSHAGTKVAIDTRCRRPYEPHRGARKLTRNIAAAGGWIIAPGVDPWNRPVIIPKGAAICKKTGPVWQGHFMTAVFHNLSTDAVTIIEGNKNNRKAKDGHRYAVIDIRDLSPTEWRRDLYGISALWLPKQPGK
jgi:hypothetical protein